MHNTAVTTEKIPVVVVTGPTASGKTGLAISLANLFNSEIVSADSMQIYKGMDIATAKPTENEQAMATHHMIDFLDTTSSFSVAQYVNMANNVISGIVSREKLPIIVGGTGLYIDALIYNTQFAEEPDNTQLRTELSAQYEEIGGVAMLSLLAEIDSDTSARLHQNDKKRIIRAFEVYKNTGEKKSDLDKLAVIEPSKYTPTIIGLRYDDRELLYSRINSRVDAMLENGLLEEALHERTKITSNTAVSAIGHKELLPYFDEEMTLDEAVENLKRATRRYAKRQMTWFNKNRDINWINCDDKSTQDIVREAQTIIERNCI